MNQEFSSDISHNLKTGVVSKQPTYPKRRNALQPVALQLDLWLLRHHTTWLTKEDQARLLQAVIDGAQDDYLIGVEMILQSTFSEYEEMHAWYIITAAGVDLFRTGAAVESFISAYQHGNNHLIFQPLFSARFRAFSLGTRRDILHNTYWEGRESQQ